MGMRDAKGELSGGRNLDYPQIIGGVLEQRFCDGDATPLLLWLCSP